MNEKVNVFCLFLLCISAAFFSCAPTASDPEINVKTDSVIVYDYRPVMGQFVNVLPQYEEGDDQRAMNLKAQQSLRQGSVITLGGFGGYVTLGLGKQIDNTPDQRDFRVLGNAFASATNSSVGNSEPGVVWVSRDDNGNGIPDDTWYELAGSEYYKEETQHGYTKTWHRSDTTMRNSFHRQPYFPMWIADSVMCVTGTLLASHKVIEEGTIAQQILDYGYADNHPNIDTIGTAFDLDWAVDSDGSPHPLDKCHFVRIVTAVDEVYPMIGELSTEVAGLEIIENK
ncbi:MAG: hypothetical protein IJ776_05440 [Paludibacteraceae bacterium]|nr:hypothetical protein [Paludibacteraceae bacterium]